MTKSFISPRSRRYFKEKEKVCTGSFLQIAVIHFPLIVPSAINYSSGLQANIGRR